MATAMATAAAPPTTMPMMAPVERALEAVAVPVAGTLEGEGEGEGDASATKATVVEESTTSCGGQTGREATKRHVGCAPSRLYTHRDRGRGDPRRVGSRGDEG